MSDDTKPTEAPKAKFDAQAYAMRVWRGQSPSLPVNERVRRVEAALAGQGVKSMRGIKLPNKDAEDLL